jgi:hypothetical protein
MIVTTKLDDTDFSKCVPLIKHISTLRLPGGTQAMGTYAKKEHVPATQSSSNRHFIIQDSKLAEMAAYVNEHNLNIIWVWNINDTFQNQLAIVKKINLLTSKLTAIEFSNETYLKKFALGQLGKNGVSRKYSVEDYIFDLKNFFEFRNEHSELQSLDVIVCGASYDNSNSAIMDYRRAWNPEVKKALNGIFGSVIPYWVLTSYHIYISALTHDDGNEEISFGVLDLGFLYDISTPVITEMGSHFGADHPKTKNLFDAVFEAIGSVKRFGFHVYYSAYSLRIIEDKYQIDHHPFALYDKNGLAKFGEFIQGWVETLSIKEEVEPPVVEPPAPPTEPAEPTLTSVVPNRKNEWVFYAWTYLMFSNGEAMRLTTRWGRIPFGNEDIGKTKKELKKL